LAHHHQHYRQASRNWKGKIVKKLLLPLPAVLFIIGICPAASANPAIIPPVSFSRIYFDSPGSDTRSNTSLNAEWVRLTNNTDKAIPLKGWTLRDAANHVYGFKAADRLGAAQSLILHTGKGTDGRPDSADRYWQSGNYVWNNTGDTATLRNSTGGMVDTCTFKTGVVTAC
jgi:hypothetical protein